MTRVAIMQPAYLPWSGYFGLMRSVDLFIILDSVQFARRSWQQRNRIKTASGPQWLTVPVLSKGHRNQLISEVEIDREQYFFRGHVHTLELNYNKAPYFDRYAPQLFQLLSAENQKLSELTVSTITFIRESLGISTPLMRSSDLKNEGTKADLLVSLCDQVGAKEYISPPGSKGYLDESDAFSNSGKTLRYFHFSHPQYPQLFGEFLPFMSAIDMLLNYGSDSLYLIEQGCEVL